MWRESAGENGEKALHIPYSGPMLLEMPLYNKGSAFSERERREFNLCGLLPAVYESLDDQVKRAYRQLKSFDSAINQHIYLRHLQDRHEVLFYRLVSDHLADLLPIIYTPTVGEASVRFSEIYRSPRGLFVSYEDRADLVEVLHNSVKQNVKVIVVTDGERVLGLGDQGIGGMGISIGKLSIYTICGGIHPAYTLPVTLDVGTNNKKLLGDPRYMGLRRTRVTQEEYDQFVDLFVEAASRRWPGVLIQFEDFAQQNAMPILMRHKNRHCCFNDDIQGTASVTLGAVLAASRARREELVDQRIMILGGGSAGCGIASGIAKYIQYQGQNEETAFDRLFVVDRNGLFVDNDVSLRDFQRPFAKSTNELNKLNIAADADLLTLVRSIRPHIIIGVTGQAGAFTQGIVEEMCQFSERPVILPLSNPSSQSEANPDELIRWSKGKAIIATGSPFPTPQWEGEDWQISQCNNAYIFPGIGLGVIASRASKITDKMFISSSEVLAKMSPLANGTGTELLPPLERIPEISKEIAYQIMVQSGKNQEQFPQEGMRLREFIESLYWCPSYLPYKRTAM